MLYRSYLIGGLLILAPFATAQYRSWSIFSASEDKNLPGTARGVYHK